jgi:hypothetical protein
MDGTADGVAAAIAPYLKFGNAAALSRKLLTSATTAATLQAFVRYGTSVGVANPAYLTALCVDRYNPKRHTLIPPQPAMSTWRPRGQARNSNSSNSSNSKHSSSSHIRRRVCCPARLPMRRAASLWFARRPTATPPPSPSKPAAAADSVSTSWPPLSAR